MHPPHVVSMSEFFKNPMKPGPHPMFNLQKDEKKINGGQKDNKKKEDVDKNDKPI